MIEQQTQSGGHFKVGVSSDGEHILVQIQNKYGDQAREILTLNEAKYMTELLYKAVLEVEND